MKTIFFFLLIFSSATQVFGESVFNVDSASFNDQAVQAVLQNAQDDFNAVLEGNKPIHSVVDPSAPTPMDGGTKFYKGNGYNLTVTQSLVRIGSIDGYMYGPSIVLLSPYAVGNSTVVSHVVFYSRTALGRLLDHSKVK